MIKEKFKDIWQIIKYETSNSKSLSENQKEQFKNLFGAEDLTDSLMYNEFNLIFLNYGDYQKIGYLLRENDIIIKFEVPEYSENIIIARYINDNILSEILS